MRSGASGIVFRPSEKLTDMATSVVAARGLTYHAAWLRQEGVD